jgi:hypothetical protein
LLEGLVIAATFAIVSPALAHHVPVGIDIPILRPDEGEYMEFINITEHGIFPAGLVGTPCASSPPGVIETEERTGYTTDPPGPVDIRDVGDLDTTAGDIADFDWVQEHRADELAGISNHAPLVGALGWTCDSPDLSPHFDPLAGPHAHLPIDELLVNPPCPLHTLLNTVDVFSTISVGEDSAAEIGSPGSREAALDYELAFCNSLTGASSVGVPVIAWIPGWTGLTTTDDYVARWTAATPGLYDSVAIEPAAGGEHNEVTEIDAIKVVGPEAPYPNHFKVYDVDNIPVNEIVLLEDQFTNLATITLEFDLFANPVDKNFEGILDINEHQKWYSLLDEVPVPRTFDVSNQFGAEQWQTTLLRYLVVPSSKDGSPGPGSCTAPAPSVGLPCAQHSDCDVIPGDGVCGGLRHFMCYDAVGTHDPIIVELDDQFGPEPGVAVLLPRYWCNPVQKTVGPDVYPIVDDIHHLACYDIEPKFDHAPLWVATRDQLDESPAFIRTNELLCVPSIKVLKNPLAVELADFSGAASGGSIRLTWETESEIDNEGFNVLRRKGQKGDYEVINAALIPAEGGPAFGASYEFVDATAKRGHKYSYLLEDVDTSGVSTSHGDGGCTVGDADCEPVAVRLRGRQ